MDEYNEQADNVANRVKEHADQLRDNVVELKSKAADQQVVDFCKANALQLITAVATVGILLNNRRSLKFTKQVVKSMDKNMRGAQEAIKTLKEAGTPFTFYPGVGIWAE